MVEYFYRETPTLNGVKRVITERLVLTRMSAGDAVQKIAEELSGADFGGLYFLLNPELKEIYIGETANILNRIKTHIRSSPVNSFSFTEVLILWDGRPIQTSQFNEQTLRRALESDCVSTFKNNSNYAVKNTVESGLAMSIYQEYTVNKFIAELRYLLYKFHLISEIPEEEILSQELTEKQMRDVLSSKDLTVDTINASQKKISCLNNRTVFYRSGSIKTQGWQVTMRDTFFTEMLSGKDSTYFLLNRTIAYLIPSSFFVKHLGGLKQGNTLDFFIKDKEEVLHCRDVDVDISAYKVLG